MIKDKEATFNDAYASLNVAQRQAVDTIEGPVMVIAGPGTGKTQILTLRIANILKQTDSKAENILALTFTNSGVRAMRERLRTYIKDEAYRVGIYTFHSFAEHVLQSYSSYFPAREFSDVISEVEKAKLLEKILEEHEFSEIVSTYDKFSSLKQVMGAIDEIKQEGLQPDEYESLIPEWEQEQLEADEMFYKRATGKHKVGDIKPAEKQKVEKKVAKAREIATVFKVYQRELQKANLYDFSDMILTVLEELEKNENLKLDLQEQYQYVLVDEHQDTNEGQNKLIELLTDAEHLDGRPNLFTVGDEKQSIYRFQGASDKAFEHFQSHYTDVKLIELEQNYRSSAAILSASHEVIKNSLPNAKELSSNKDDNKLVSVLEFSDYKFELLFLVKNIVENIKKGVPVEEMAVIYRSNKHLAEIKTLFQQFEVPYQVLSRDTLLDDSSIMMLITLVRVINNPYDDSSLGRLLFADFLELDSIMVANTLQEYRRLVRERKDIKGLIDVIREKSEYKSVVNMVASLQTFNQNHTFNETFKETLHTSGFLKTILNNSDSRSGLRKIEILFNEFRAQADRVASYQASDFLAFVDASISYNLNIEVTAAQIGKGVQCMTAHGSKGLEFEYVYLVNTAMSNWEKSRGFPKITLPLERYAGDIDDERRLFYVAITRAKTHLYISSSKQDWSGKVMEPSQFISELSESSVQTEATQSFETENEFELARFLSNEPLKESVFDIEYLAARFKEENLSVTALNNYLDCPIRYLFRNLIQLPDVYTLSLRYGNTVHESLEVFFKACAEEKKVLPRTRLLKAYEDAMKSSGFYEKDFDRFLLKGRQALGMYYDYYAKDWLTDILLEEYIRVTVALGDIELTLSGKIDKIEFLDEHGQGRVRVVDYKTGKVFSQKSTKAQKQALERQIQFYHLLLRDYKKGEIQVAEAVLDFVEPTKQNEFEKKTLAVSEKDLQDLQNSIQTMAKEVISGLFLTKGCKKKDCEMCNFFNSLQNYT